MAKDLKLPTNQKTKNLVEEIQETKASQVIDLLTTPIQETPKKAIQKTEKPQQKKRGRPRQYEATKKSADMGLPDNLTRSSFIVNKETLKQLKDFAFNENLKIYEALDLILSSYLERYAKNNKGMSEREKKTKRLKEL